MRKLLYLFVFYTLFISCKKEESNFFVKEKTSVFDSLFKTASNVNLKRDLRLNSANEVYNRLISQSNDLLDVDKHLQLANSYYYLEDYDKYVRMHKNLLRFSKETNNTYAGVKSNYGLGVYNLIIFSNDSAFYYFSKAERLAKKSIDTFYLEEILASKANLLFLNKDYSGSEIVAIDALRIALKNNNHRIVYDCYITIGNSRKGLNDFDKAFEYYKKAIEKTKDLENDPQFISLKAQPYNYIAKILQKQGRYKEAIFFVNKTLKSDESKKLDPIMMCYLVNNKAYSKFKLGDNKCLPLFEETLKIGDSLQSVPIQLTSKLNLSEYYLFQKDSLKAQHFSEEARQLAHKNKVFEDELKALELLAKIDPKNDSHYNQRYITLNDSLQNVERATRNKFARIEFETDEITNQKNLAETEKEKISAQRWMILGFSLFFIVLLMLLYVSHRQRSKNKELQYRQQQQQANEEIYRLMFDQQQKIEEGKQIEKRRISKELHDGVMGKLTAIRLNLFVLNKKTDPETITRCMEHVNEIQNIEKEIRKISHDLNHNLFTDVSDFILMVNNLVDNIKEHSHVQFKIITDEKLDWNIVNSVVKMQVYRILQEALQNIEKYAQANNVVISMLEKEGKLSVTITDDGIGFDINSAKNGIGHKNMRERAAEIKGEFAISSIVGKGTKINLIIPT